MYKAFAKELLKENPTWWGKFDQKLSNFRIYAKVGNSVKEMMSYPRFRAALNSYFKAAAKYIIQGHSLRLGSSLGRIAGRRVARNHGLKTVDWKATRKLWEEKGERKGLIYFVDDEWVRIGWEKGSRIKNERFYRFSPAEGNTNKTGFKQEFSEANEKDDLLKYKYKYYPFIVYD